jgi:nucleoside-diphosphate-sugar epimerase
VKGVDAVIHAASPATWIFEDPKGYYSIFYQIKQSYDVFHTTEVIGPAVNGIVNMLKSTHKHGKNVKRVIMTSSIIAVVQPGEACAQLYDEVSLPYHPFNLGLRSQFRGRN